MKKIYDDQKILSTEAHDQYRDFVRFSNPGGQAVKLWE